MKDIALIVNDFHILIWCTINRFASNEYSHIIQKDSIPKDEWNFWYQEVFCRCWVLALTSKLYVDILFAKFFHIKHYLSKSSEYIYNKRFLVLAFSCYVKDALVSTLDLMHSKLLVKQSHRSRHILNSSKRVRHPGKTKVSMKVADYLNFLLTIFS